MSLRKAASCVHLLPVIAVRHKANCVVAVPCRLRQTLWRRLGSQNTGNTSWEPTEVSGNNTCALERFVNIRISSLLEECTSMITLFCFANVCSWKQNSLHFIYLLKLITLISEMLKLLVYLSAENMGWNPAQISDEIQSTPEFPCVYKSFTMDPCFCLRILQNR